MLKIVCLGDSVTSGGREDFPPLGIGFVQVISQQLTLKGISHQIINRGVNGATVARILEGVRREAVCADTDIATILAGVNDLSMMLTTGRTAAQQQEMMTRFAQNYRELLKAVTSRAKRTLLIEPFIFPRPAEYLTWLPARKAMSEAVASLAMEFHLPYIQLHNDLNAAASASSAGDYSDDGIHLTRKGALLAALAVLPAITER